MHSVRMEACDCPPSHHSPSEGKTTSSVLSGGDPTHFVGRSDDVAQKDGFDHYSEYSQVKKDDLIWGTKKSKRNKGHDPVKKTSHVGEKPRSSMQESEKHRRVGNNGFLRVLFWKFHNFRMLLGSDLLLFSNEKYVAVSLHLWDVVRQVTPLTWLDAWLDNLMASVPELAICYHENGVVQGYELLKTDDIFLLKGISDDGSPAFHPHVVQQNGLSVLRFLQENCKQDPGAYWLYKSAGEDVIQLFDLSVLPKSHSSNDSNDSSSFLPSLIHKGRTDSLFSLGTLLYRIAHRLSLSMAPNARAKCTWFFRKCLDFLDEPDHLVVRAFAHEQFARLILNYDEELDLTSESFPMECEVTVTDVEEENLDPFVSFSEPVDHEKVSFPVAEDKLSGDEINSDLASVVSLKMTSEANLSPLRKLMASDEPEKALVNSSDDQNFAACMLSPTAAHLVQTVTDPISSKLAAVHHVSQAIKSLRWMRQLQNSEQELVDQSHATDDMLPSSVTFSICACGDTDCIEVCDIQEWLPTSKLDHKLWKLVLLLGESYLALGQAYKEDGQLHQALKIVELACSAYGSMPQKLEDSRFISSMIKCFPSQARFNDGNGNTKPVIDDFKEVKSSSHDDCLTLEQLSCTYLFWAKAWTLVGDVYVEFHVLNNKENSKQSERVSNNKETLKQSERYTSTRELRMSSEVVKEVQRLKKKLGQYNQNCSSCSLVNCSCQSDRASSGSSASSSSGDSRSVAYSRKHLMRSHAKNVPNSLLGNVKDDCAHQKTENRKCCNSGKMQRNEEGDALAESFNIVTDNLEINSLITSDSKMVGDSLGMHNQEPAETSEIEIASRRTSKVKNGGIFKYLKGPAAGDAEHNLSAALSCYEEAKKAFGGLSTGSTELQSIIKKKGWICNELGRYRLERRELNKAEVAFADAICAFREVSDNTNIILILCNLGHGRRAYAEVMVTEIEYFKIDSAFHNAYRNTLETAKEEYSESLRYYEAAKSELKAVTEEAGPVSNSIRNEVYTQLANTYLRLGMLLARENTVAEVYENGPLEDVFVPRDIRVKKELRKHELSANAAIREALSLYESLGELRKQEAAYAYFQLACYQRDCCLKFLESDHKGNLPKGESHILQRLKQYASLAERNWQKAMDFYVSKTHATMYLTILLERSALSFSLSSSLQSNAMLEAALCHLLEGRHVSEEISDFLRTSCPELHAKFWSQLQMVLKKMLTAALSSSMSKHFPPGQTTLASNRSGDAGKLRELYKMSLKSTDMSELPAMHSLWIS